MARPMAFDKDMAVDKAMQLLWRDGYEASSVKSLSEALGITRSSFYNSFGSRDELFKLALDHYLSTIPEAALFTEAAETAFPAFMTALMRDVCRMRTSETAGAGCLAANSIAEILPAETLAAKSIEDLTHTMIDRLRALVEGAVSRSELPKETDPNALSLAIHGMIMGLNLQSKIVTDEAELWTSARQSLRGLGLYEE
ncbi:MAG: TetR/AcrR family transcriptional regulator [Pseudomonadota bacterium]